MNSVASALSLKGLDGRVPAVSGYLGQVPWLNLWATWRPSCIAEASTPRRFRVKYFSQGFAVVGVNGGERPYSVEAFMESSESSFPMWLDPGSIPRNTQPYQGIARVIRD
jgi:hypothetical protein